MRPSCQFQFLRSGFTLCLLFILGWGLTSINLQAQATDDLEKKFGEAREKAFAGNYADARVLLEEVLKKKEDYHDARILLARTYAWEKQYEPARAELAKVVSFDPDNQDAINAQIDVELWSQHFEEAIRLSDLGLSYYPNFEDYLLKKAKALIGLERFDEAAIELNKLLTINPSHTEALDLLKSLRGAALRNFITLHYYLSFFDNKTDPWHFVSFEYGRIFKPVTLIARVNYANRYRQSGEQFEVDAYPKFGKGTYGYLNAGYSNDILLFPKVKLGAELFQKLPSGFEVSAGARLLSFPQIDILLYTASLSKYYRSCLFMLRGFASFNAQQVSPTVIFSVRKYLSGDANNYVMLTLSQGSIPSLNNFQFVQELIQLNSSHAAFDFQYGLGHNYYLRGGLWYDYEEFTSERYRNRYTANIGIHKRF